MEPSLRTLLAGTRNAGKVKEIKLLLKDLQVEVRDLSEFPELPEVDETALSYEGNSRLKALTYADLTKIPTLADDSGLEVLGLEGMLGVRSARFGGPSASQAEKTEAVLNLLKDQPQSSRKARFVCCLSFAAWENADESELADPSILHVARGVIDGNIANEPRGTNGFGYDPVFVPDGYSQTFAELPNAIKNEISHRAKALLIMKEFLKRWIGQT